MMTTATAPLRALFPGHAWLLLPFLLVAGRALCADESPRPVSFVKDIAPILQTHCFACHNAEKADGGFALDTFERLRKGGDSGNAIVPDNSGKSSLMELLGDSDKDVRMPKKAAPLPEEQIALVKRWIDEGAKSDADLTFVLRPLQTSLPEIPAVPQQVDVKITTVQPPLDCRITYGPASPAAALAFSPDGKFLAMGAYEQVLLWDLQSATLAKVLTGLPGVAYSLAFSSDGKLLACGGGIPREPGSIKVWDIASGDCKFSTSGHKDSVYALALSPDGKWLASGSADGIVNILDLATGHVVHVIKEHAGWIFGLVFSADSQLLATASDDKTVRVFKSNQAWQRADNFDYSEPIWNVAFNPSGSQIAAAVGGPSEKSVIIRNRADGKIARTLTGHAGPVTDVAWSADGKWILSASADKSARLFDANNGSLKAKFSDHAAAVYSSAFSSDGKIAATGDAEGIVRLWSVAEGQPLATLVPLNTSASAWMIVSSRGYYSASKGTLSVEWRQAGKSLPANGLQRILATRPIVARLLAGEKVDPPAIPGE